VRDEVGPGEYFGGCGEGSMKLKAVCILGSPRRKSNTEILLNYLMEELRRYNIATTKIVLREYNVKPCYSCRKCLELGVCCLNDDMTNHIVPQVLQAHILVIATPVYFDNVTSLTKVFMDRTWCLRGKLKNKVLGCVVVGRGYGLDSALTAIHNWGLKHRMILCDRGVAARGFNYGDVLADSRAFKDAKQHAKRLAEVARVIYQGGGFEIQP